MRPTRLVLPLLLAATAAFATPTGRKWTTIPPGYRVFSHTSITGVANFSTAVLPKVQAAFATWTKTQVGCTSWDITYLGSFSMPTGTSAINGGDGQNRVIWQSGGSWRYGGSVLGLTTTSYIPSTGQITDGDMEMNNNVTWSVTGSMSAFDVQSIVLHEAGHLLGLDHTNDAAAVMYPSIAQGQVKATLGTADLSDVCTVYPSGGGALATITVTPSPASMTINGTQQFTATGKDGSGNAVPVTPGWTVVSGGGTISAAGVFTAGSTPGTFTNTVRATSGAIFGSATVVIGAGAVASISLTPNPASLAVTGAQQFTAVGKDSGGNVVAFTPVWGVAAGGGTINSSGIFTAGTVPGTFTNTVTASSGSGPALTTTALITVTPTSGSMGGGGTQQYSAAGTDAYANPVAISPVWAVVNGGGTVGATGLFTAGTVSGTFPGTVEASASGRSGTATAVVNPGPVAIITVTPGSTSLSIGATQQFSASAKDSYGNATPLSPTWSVGSGGGSITGSGFFTAGSAAGTFTDTVRAASGAVAGNASVTVTAGALASVTVTPSSATIPVSATLQFTAAGKDSGGNPVPISPVWSVISGGGTISPAGLFTAGSTAGTFTNTVRATASGFASSATVTVTVGALSSMTVAPSTANVPVNGTHQFTAGGTDTGGNPINVSPIWSVVAGGGTISPSGLFTAGTTTGTFSSTVKATSGSVVAYASVNVLVGPLATITVVPSTASLAAGAMIQLTASGADSAGNFVPVSPTWSVVNGGGTISSGGFFTAGGAAGTFTNTVRANSGSVRGYASLTVNPGPLANIVLSPSPASVAAGGTVQFTAIGKDASGNTVPVSPVWTATSGGVISTGGLFTAGTAAGTFSNAVTATSGSVTASATVTVTSSLATISILPSTPTVPQNGTIQFTATGADGSGNPVAVSPMWSVASGGTISSSGLFTAATTPGSFSVTATSGNVIGAATVTVSGNALASITLTPATASVAIGGSVQFTATGTDSAGTPVAVAPSFTVTGGTINAAGLFTAGTLPGSFSVVATSGAVMASAAVTVTAGPLAAIAVSPAAASVLVDGEVAFTAQGKDSAGNPVSASITWGVANGGGAIDSGGRFTAGTVVGTFTDTVVASSGAVSGKATVSVTTRVLASLTVTPNPGALVAGSTLQLTAAGADVAGAPLSVATSWDVVSGVGSVSLAGLFTSNTAGSSTVRASSGAISATTAIRVQPGPVARVDVTPPSVIVAPMEKKVFAAVAFDSFGNGVPGAGFDWQATGGSITSAGEFTAGALAGEYADAVRASSGSVTGHASVSIVAVVKEPSPPSKGCGCSSGLGGNAFVLLAGLLTVLRKRTQLPTSSRHCS